MLKYLIYLASITTTVKAMDIFGQALWDHYSGTSGAKLWLHNSYGHPEEMPVDVFFRDEAEMPELELLALSLCKGKILDIGAGVGSHTLALQRRGADVTALEISASACSIMEDRGVHKRINMDIEKFGAGKFDTLLLLMNGIGLSGDLAGLRKFLNHARTLLNPNGILLFDSSDISYLYEDIPVPPERYLGEISFRYEYKSQFGEWFNWLYVDADMLNKIAAEEGWTMELLFDDEMDQYLASLSPFS